MKEEELKIELSLKDYAKVLSAMQVHHSKTLITTYYDTADWQLSALGCTLRHRRTAGKDSGKFTLKIREGVAEDGTNVSTEIDRETLDGFQGISPVPPHLLEERGTLRVLRTVGTINGFPLELDLGAALNLLFYEAEFEGDQRVDAFEAVRALVPNAAASSVSKATRFKEALLSAPKARWWPGQWVTVVYPDHYPLKGFVGPGLKPKSRRVPGIVLAVGKHVRVYEGDNIKRSRAYDKVTASQVNLNHSLKDWGIKIEPND